MAQRRDIPFPIVSQGGQPSHVLVPIKDWDALFLNWQAFMVAAQPSMPLKRQTLRGFKQASAPAGANGSCAATLSDLPLQKNVADGHTFVPLDVGEAVLEGHTPLKAWRNHKRLTQADLAERMRVTRSSYAQMEKSARPRKSTLEKAAVALGVKPAQLVELYYD